MNRILVIDDDIDLCELLTDYLTTEGFAVEVTHDGEAGAARALDGDFELVVLDVMLPGISGFEVLRQLRTGSATPVLMLTARGDDVDRIVGLEMGADDYLPKPFNPRELVARIRAVLRRMDKPAADSQTLQVRNVILNRTTRTVTVDNQAADLTPSEFELLATLMQTPGRVFSRTDLLEELQGHDYEGVERTIDVHIRNLRAKIEPDPANPIYIQTVFGVGYRFSHEDQR